MAIFVYFLCGVASFFCAYLQFRAYMRGRARFFLWTTICFGAIFVNNAMLLIDASTGPEVNLVIPRTLILLGGLSALIYGLVWEVA